MYLDFCKIDSYDVLLFSGNEKAIEEKIIDFIDHLNEKNLTSSFFTCCLAALKHFYNMNDIELRWGKIHKFVGRCKPRKKDRPYTRQELQKLMEFAVIREKVMICLCSSRDMMIGTLPSLKCGDEPITILDNGVGIYMIKVYEGEK